ncbi:MAG: ribonuclease P protein component [Bacteroidales bacterium]|jgi:ribonuclease P protein component|nr:ribonuclease P protein component [Bacteroidales bacterium]
MRAVDVKSSAFPKSCRLKSSLRIKAIVLQRCVVFYYPIKCFFHIGAAEGTKLAVIVPKKRFPHATDRNRVKRLMREAYRLNRHLLLLPDQCGVEMCWMYVGGELPTYKQVCATVEHIFTELQSVIQKESI